MNERRATRVLWLACAGLGLALATGCAGQQAAALRERAAQELARQDGAAAEASLQASIAREDSPAARAQLGHLLAAREACAEALPQLERGAAYEPFAVQTSADSAHCQLALKNYPLAAEAFLLAVAKAPGNHDLLLESALLWPELDAHPRITLWLNELVRLTPQSHYAPAFLGNHFYRQQKYKEAAEAYAAAESVFARSSSLFLRHGLSLLAGGDYAQAIVQFERAQVLEPSSDALIGLAFARYKLGAAKETLAALDAALKLDPQQAQALSFKAQILFEAREYGEALTLIETALKGKPQSAELMAFRARLLFEKGAAAQALEAINEALAKAAPQAEWLETKGAALLALNRPTEAREALVAALTQDSKRTTSLRRLGVALYMEKLYPQALKALREALRREAQNGEALLYAGLAAFESGAENWSEAQGWLTAACADPKAVFPRTRLAAILASQGHSKEALAQLSEAVRLGFTDVAFLKHDAFKKLASDRAFLALQKQLTTK